MRQKYFLLPMMIIVIIAISVGCSSNIEKVTVEIPPQLKDNKEAVEVIEDMTEAVNDCREYMQKATKFAIAQEKSGADSLSITQGLKVAMIAGKIMLSQKKIEKCHLRVDQLSKNLSRDQSFALVNCINNLEDRIGEINTEALGLSDEELAKLKKGDDLNYGNQTTDVSQKETDSITALREEAIDQMKSEGIYTEPAQKPGNVIEPPIWFSIAFPIFVIGLMIFIFFMGIRIFYKKIKRTVGDLSYVKNDVLKHIKNNK